MTTTPLTPAVIAERIAAARKAAGLNQSELARACGVTPQAVQKWEKCTATPRFPMLIKIAAALELEPVGLTPIAQ